MNTSWMDKQRPTGFLKGKLRSSVGDTLPCLTFVATHDGCTQETTFVLLDLFFQCYVCHGGLI